MLNKDAYFNGYQEQSDQLIYLKYGLINEYGREIDRSNNIYLESNILKKKCNIKKTLPNNK